MSKVRKKTVATTLPQATQKHLFSSMMLQLNSQAKHQEQLKQQLNHTAKQLENAQKILAQKNRLIDSLEIDLEHVVDQLTKLKTTTKKETPKASGNLWISRPVPGLNSIPNTEVA